MARSLRPRPAKGMNFLIQATKDLEIDAKQYVLINIGGLNTPNPFITVRGIRPTARALSKEQLHPEIVKKGVRIVGVFGDGGESGRDDDFAVVHQELSEDERKSEVLEARQKMLDKREYDAVEAMERNADAVLEAEGSRKKQCADAVAKSVEKGAPRSKTTTKKTPNRSPTQPRQPKAPQKPKNAISNYATRSKHDPDADWNTAIESNLASWKPKPHCRKGYSLQEKGSTSEMMASLGRTNIFQRPDAHNILTSFPEKKMDPEAVVAFVTLFGSPIPRNWRQFIEEINGGWAVKNTKAVEKWAREMVKTAPERVRFLLGFLEREEPFVSEWRRKGVPLKTL